MSKVADVFRFVVCFQGFGMSEFDFMVDYVVVVWFPECWRWFGQFELIPVSECFALAFVVLCVVVYRGVLVARPDEVGSYDGFNERAAPPPGAAHDA